MSVPEVLASSFNQNTEQGKNEVMLFDLLRVYIFDGSDLWPKDPVHLGGSSAFSVEGVTDSIKNKGKRSFTEVIERAFHTFMNTPLAGDIPLALMAFGAYAFGSTKASGLAPPNGQQPSIVNKTGTIASAAISAAKNTRPGQFVSKNIGNMKERVGKNVGKMKERVGKNVGNMKERVGKNIGNMKGSLSKKKDMVNNATRKATARVGNFGKRTRRR